MISLRPSQRKLGIFAILFEKEKEKKSLIGLFQSCNSILLGSIRHEIRFQWAADSFIESTIQFAYCVYRSAFESDCGI